ncbi:chitin synthase [Batrachochytrium dendrobatidis JEL423]|uniref:Chitin synthase n=1 Tax=Batrachochytrium dendrobatidis (strain JEL423) TaxID=403673 RepID=A0A177WZF2_BATDL|nr:chitin synthase [Batrachochytrium dendrobatidis JEL423]
MTVDRQRGYPMPPQRNQSNRSYNPPSATSEVQFSPRPPVAGHYQQQFQQSKYAPAPSSYSGSSPPQHRPLLSTELHNGSSYTNQMPSGLITSLSPSHRNMADHSIQYGVAANPNASQLIPHNAIARKRTVRNIPLTPQGNLVIDVPVPDRVLQMGKIGSGEEFTHMRYTAVTCPADDFVKRGYTLRQQEYARPTELFIVVTMYNEDDYLFCKSMQALFKNIVYLCSRTRSKTWGVDGWKKAIICIVSDGRAKVNPRVLDVLGLMGVYQEGIMKDHVNERPVTAHLFEYTTQVCVTPELKVHGHEKGYVPVQIMFCLKENNAKKINSHRWFFNSFGPLIRPNICILIDVGTKPTNTSLYSLWKSFDKNASIGGACGEIYAELGPGCTNLFNPLVAAQNFEYKMSNILDKPFESVCGFISVLPGAFSAYRYAALQGRPLEQYFKGELMHDGADIFAANMYLAEDRILCFEISTKRGEAWLLKYVKAAKAETDVPDSVPEFISQRRRWLNGSFFAGVHSLTHWYYIFRSGHGILRKLLLLLEYMYNFIQLIFNWFGLSSFYLTFTFLYDGFINKNVNLDGVPIQLSGGLGDIDPFFGKTDLVFQILRELYIFAIVLIFISSMGNRPQGSKYVYASCIFIFAVIMGSMIYLSGFSVFSIVQQLTPAEKASFSTLWVSNPAMRDTILSVGATYGIYIVASLMHLDPWHMLTSFPQYMFFLPAFTNILNVYAFCNLHDVSWGTKGDNSASSLGGAKTIKGKDGKMTVEVEVPTDHNDINANYETFIRNLRQPRPNEKKRRDAKTKQEDYFHNFRTRIVLTWMFMNAAVIIVFTTESIRSRILPVLGIRQTKSFNPYLQFIFYSILGLTGVRFIGSTMYLITNAVFR